MLDENNVKKPGVFNKLFIKKLTGKLHKIWKTLGFLPFCKNLPALQSLENPEMTFGI